MGKGRSSRRAHLLLEMVGTPSARAFARAVGFAHPTNSRMISLLERLRDAAEPLVDRRDLVLEGFNLRSRCRVEGAGRRSALGALNHRELVAAAERREQRELETMSSAFDACRDCHAALQPLRSA
jgi:hypothetical protein